MSILDKLMGREEAPAPARPATGTTDEQAVARYQYMLRTAPPESIEQAHEEAFARLTPEQRQIALQKLSENAPPEERPQGDDPQSLARAATRAEIRQPGALGNAFGGGGGMGLGGIIGGSLLGSLAGIFIGSSIAHSFFSNPAHAQGYNEFAGQNGVDANGGVANGTEVANDAQAAEPDPMGDPADSVDTGSDFGGMDDLGVDF